MSPASGDVGQGGGFHQAIVVSNQVMSPASGDAAAGAGIRAAGAGGFQSSDVTSEW
jgi:hypothetical protein